MIYDEHRPNLAELFNFVSGLGNAEQIFSSIECAVDEDKDSLEGFELLTGDILSLFDISGCN